MRRSSADAGRTHGDAAARAAHAAAQDVVDFAVTVNPYGPHPAVREAIGRADPTRYPDPAAGVARGALARRHGVEPDCVLLAPGATDLLWHLARCLVPPGAVALTVGPAFSEWGAGVAAAGGRPVEWSPDAGADDVESAARAVVQAGATACYVATPANPTGAAWPLADCAALAARIAPAVCVVDLAFHSLGDLGHEPIPRGPANAVWVWSLTKEHAIPGVRVGYAIAEASRCARLDATRPTWATSAAAQAAAVAAAPLDDFVAASRRRLREDRAALAAVLAARGLAPCARAAPWVLVRVPDARARAAALARRGVFVRDCSSFGLPEHWRLAARPAADRERLAAALAEVE